MDRPWQERSRPRPEPPRPYPARRSCFSNDAYQPPPSLTLDIVRSPSRAATMFGLVEVGGRTGPAPLGEAPVAIEHWRRDLDPERPSTDGRGLVHVSHPSRG